MYESGAGKFRAQLQETSSPYLHPDQDEKLRASAHTQEGLECERIPYLILPVTQLSREPFGSRRSDTRKRYERAVGQYAGPVSIRTIRRSDTRERYERAVVHTAGPASNHPPSCRAHRAVHRAIRRASRCHGATYDPALKSPPEIPN